jgi:endonuclease YncB( thermonuclease family)
MNLNRPSLQSICFAALIAISVGPAVAETRVVDGDTLEVDGTIYRLNGIDAPEHGQTCGDWRCGQAATEALVEIVKGQDVTCDGIEEDGYGRVVATCFADGSDIGADLVDKGMAWAFVRYSDAYLEEERAARARADGIWSGQFQEPWAFREAQWNRAQSREQTAPKGCPIKGNISGNGRIYHAPWSPWYSRTRINTSKGERWFCSEADALAAGWRAPYWN